VDILSRIPFLNSKTEPDDDRTDEAIEAEAKAERIRFHREKVRNGPTNFKFLTNGQIKRAERRELAGRTRKARRAQVKNYFDTQRLAASVRGHLQSAGVLPYAVEREIDRQQQVVSAAWLVTRFGVDIEDTDEVSFAYNDVLIALGAALKFYGQAVGLPDLRVPADYVVPIYEEGTAPAGVATA
jgi:hypothetical protein